MSGYEFFYQGDTSDQTSLLQSIKTGIESLAEKTQSKPVRSKCVILDSQTRDANTSNYNPTFTFSSPITCAQDEYMSLTVLRWNGFHDWADIPPNSQISFQKGTSAPFTLTLSTFGKPPFNNIATAVQNAWILAGQGAGFSMTYNQNRGCYLINYSSQLTMTVLSEDLAKYMNVPYNTPITSVANQIATGVLRAQKTINLALCVSGVSSFTSNTLGNTGKTVLCHIPILSNSYVLAAYRSYVENEQALRIVDKSISSLSFEYIDTYNSQLVPVAETCLTLEINTYKI